MSLQRHRWGVVRWPLAICVVILVALVVRIALVWAALPPVVASHFDAGGTPNDTMGRLGFFILMGVIMGGTVLLLFGMPLFLRSLPSHMLNVPNRDYWLANDTRRIEALDRLAAFLGWMGAATTALFALALELTIRANLSGGRLQGGVLMVALVAYAVVTVAAIAWQMRALRVPEPEAG